MKFRLLESVKDVVSFMDNKDTDLEKIKDDLMNMGFICISSSISDVSNMKATDKDGNSLYDPYANGEKDDLPKNQWNLYDDASPRSFEAKGDTVESRDSNLKDDIKDSGYLFFEARGMFEGEAEPSFMVLPLKPTTDEDSEDESGFDYENFDDLKDFGQSLTNLYNQYSVLVQEPVFEGGAAYYMDGKGHPVDAMDNVSFDTAKVIDAYASTMVGRDTSDNKKGGFTYEGFYAKGDKDAEKERKNILDSASHIKSYDFDESLEQFFREVFFEALLKK